MHFFDEMKVTVAIGSSNYSKAIKICLELLERDPRDLFALEMLASCYDWTKNVDLAFEYSERAIEINPNDLSMLMLSAKYWISKNDYEKAYLCACKMNEAKPVELPSLPEWLIYLFKPLSIFPKFRNIDKAVKQDIDHSKDPNRKEIEWALKYKEWYEHNCKNGRGA